MICMHMTDKHRQAAKDNHINVIISGHMASDSLGMNLSWMNCKSGYRDTPAAGLIRVER